MNEVNVRDFRSLLRDFEREINTQNQSGCCCGITLPQCHILLELEILDNITLNDLAKKIRLNNSTISRTVETLVNNGNVKRIIPKNNRRITLLKLTRVGKEVCNRINMENDTYYMQILSSIPEDLRRPFLDGFKEMVKAMVTLNGLSGL